MCYVQNPDPTFLHTHPAIPGYVLRVTRYEPVIGRASSSRAASSSLR